MSLGPKMAFILRVYEMSEAENAADAERDLERVRAGAMSKRELRDQDCTRRWARGIRARDDAAGPAWPHTWRNRYVVQQVTELLASASERRSSTEKIKDRYKWYTKYWGGKR